jgi:hypothetical protein
VLQALVGPHPPLHAPLTQDWQLKLQSMQLFPHIVLVSAAQLVPAQLL